MFTKTKVQEGNRQSMLRSSMYWYEQERKKKNYFYLAVKEFQSQQTIQPLEMFSYRCNPI
jgi:hypothetical protein